MDSRLWKANESMPTLLVVDDEPAILHAFQRAFAGGAVEVVTASSGKEALALTAERRPDVFVLDVQLPDMTGLEAFRRLRALDARSPIVFITGFSTADTAIEAMKLGAYEYLVKPLELATLRQVIDKALSISRLMRVPAVVAGEQPTDDRSDPIVGRCPAMQEVYKAIGRVARQEVTVLITGASGAGKELVARALYQHSRRSQGPFLAVNCAAIPDALLESELFGHEKGAFTGADRRRIGKFEQCHGGTLFLDEVADLTPQAQGKLLRLLQEGTFERLGGNETLRADVRVLAATNHDLHAMVTGGLFREDLYYRLSVFTIHLPPLRERGDDLALLAEHYLRRFSRELGKEATALAPEALNRLRSYSWPGNIRELQSALKQAVLQATGPVLLADFVPAWVQPGTSETSEMAQGVWRSFIEEQLRAGTTGLYAKSLRRMERELLTQVLRHTDGNQLQAAKILGITRGSLRSKLRELGISIERTITSED
jgi:two-component system nitrogen regulation response regulator GlnG